MGGDIAALTGLAGLFGLLLFFRRLCPQLLCLRCWLQLCLLNQVALSQLQLGGRGEAVE